MRHPKPRKEDVVKKQGEFNGDVGTCCSCGKRFLAWGPTCMGICETGETTDPYGLVFSCPGCGLIQWGYSNNDMYHMYCVLRIMKEIKEEPLPF